MSVPEVTGWVALAVVLVVLLLLDLRLFARRREPSFREALAWSAGWLGLSLAATVAVLVAADGEAAVGYLTVYLIERVLSLDNLFVFLLLFAYFGVPRERRPRLLASGIVAALVLRGLAILGGVELLEAFHAVIYVLGAGLLVLAYRMLRGGGEHVDPNRSLLVRAVRWVVPVTDGLRGGRWLVTEGGRRHATPLLLCLAALVTADLAFAVDSIPAAFAITRDPLVIWMGNVFALLGMRALFVLVEGLIRRFRYLDETIAVVLGLVGLKLLLEDVAPVGPLASLAVVAAAFAVGMAASVRADRREARSGAGAAGAAAG